MTIVFILGQAADFPAGAWESSIKTLGPAGALLVLLTAAFVVIYRVAIAPELRNSREARTSERAEALKIAEANATTTKAIEGAAQDIRATGQALNSTASILQSTATILDRMVTTQAGRP